MAKLTYSKKFSTTYERESVEEHFIRNHIFFDKKKIISIDKKNNGVYVLVEDRRKKSGVTLYIVNFQQFVVERLSPITVVLVLRIKWILVRKKNDVPFSWGINGQPHKNTKLVYSESEQSNYEWIRNFRGNK